MGPLHPTLISRSCRLAGSHSLQGTSVCIPRYGKVHLVYLSVIVVRAINLPWFIGNLQLPAWRPVSADNFRLRVTILATRGQDFWSWAPGYWNFIVDLPSPLLTGFLLDSHHGSAPRHPDWSPASVFYSPGLLGLNSRPPLKLAPVRKALSYREWGNGSLPLVSSERGLTSDQIPALDLTLVRTVLSILGFSPVATSAPLSSQWPPKLRLTAWLLFPCLLTPPSPSPHPPPVQGAGLVLLPISPRYVFVCPSFLATHPPWFPVIFLSVSLEYSLSLVTPIFLLGSAQRKPAILLP